MSEISQKKLLQVYAARTPLAYDDATRGHRSLGVGMGVLIGERSRRRQGTRWRSRFGCERLRDPRDEQPGEKLVTNRSRRIFPDRFSSRCELACIRDRITSAKQCFPEKPSVA